MTIKSTFLFYIASSLIVTKLQKIYYTSLIKLLPVYKRDLGFIKPDKSLDF